MKAYIGLGANLGDARSTLETAALRLSKLGGGLRVSPLLRSPALIPDGAPSSWRLPYLNAVAELEWVGSAADLLLALKTIELELGRRPAERWAPRVLDLDLLSLGDLVLAGEKLILPHPEASRRSFVLDPWKELASTFRIPGQEKALLELGRALPGRSPFFMGILNRTPDSFSDGGRLSDVGVLESTLDRWERSLVSALDLGAESTRPGARPVDAAEEWRRLAPVFSLLRERYRGRWFRPLLSVDTHHPATAERALEAGADLLNDVSGGTNPEMLALARHSPRGIVVMHSLTVPADPKVALDPSVDPVAELSRWALLALERAEAAGVSREKVILDPGLGFGKSTAQSLELTRRFGELARLPVRWLVGHSRKSFLQAIGSREVHEREGFSVGVSFHLAEQGADWMRVHEPALHKDAFDARKECKA